MHREIWNIAPLVMETKYVHMERDSRKWTNFMRLCMLPLLIKTLQSTVERGRQWGTMIQCTGCVINHYQLLCCQCDYSDLTATRKNNQLWVGPPSAHGPGFAGCSTVCCHSQLQKPSAKRCKMWANQKSKFYNSFAWVEVTVHMGNSRGCSKQGW